MRAALFSFALLLAGAAPAEAGMALSLVRPPPGLLRRYLELIGAGVTSPCDILLFCVR